MGRRVNSGGTTSSRTRVPLIVREKIHKACQLSPVRLLGQKLYARIAKHCARRLMNLPGITSLRIRGKDFYETNPGISDLDLWILVTEQSLRDASALLEIRRTFRKLRTAFLIPGKLEVTTTDAWEIFRQSGVATYLQDLPLRRFIDPGWEKIALPPRAPITGASRFCQSIVDYNAALASLPSTVVSKRHSFHTLITEKFLAKAADFATGDHLTRHAAAPLTRRLAETFLALDSLAAQTLHELQTLATVPLAITTDGAPCSRASSAPQYLAALREFLVAAGFRVTAVAPRYLRWEESDPHLEETERLFIAVTDFFRNRANGEAPDHIPATIVSPTMLRCAWQTIAVGPLLEHLPVIPAEFRRDPDFMRALSAGVYQSCYSRSVVRLNHNLGVIATYDLSRFREPLMFQCMELMVLCAHQVTNDYRLLSALTQTQLPATVAWFNRLIAGEALSLTAWSDAYREVHREASLFHHRLPYAGASTHAA